MIEIINNLSESIKLINMSDGDILKLHKLYLVTSKAYPILYDERQKFYNDKRFSNPYEAANSLVKFENDLKSKLNLDDETFKFLTNLSTRVSAINNGRHVRVLTLSGGRKIKVR